MRVKREHRRARQELEDEPKAYGLYVDDAPRMEKEKEKKKKRTWEEEGKEKTKEWKTERKRKEVS